MTIGIIVDGDAEVVGLPALYGKIQTPHVLLKPIKASISVDASLEKIVNALRPLASILSARNAEALIILFDREQQDQCAGQIASALEQLINSQSWAASFSRIRVVLKDRMFENWLIADASALRSMSGRFSFSKSLLDQIEQGSVDSIPALNALKAAAIRRGYAKVSDAVRILQVAHPKNMESSRSFRKFLRLIETPRYVSQSKVRVPIDL